MGIWILSRIPRLPLTRRLSFLLVVASHAVRFIWDSFVSQSGISSAREQSCAICLSHSYHSFSHFFCASQSCVWYVRTSRWSPSNVFPSNICLALRSKDVQRQVSAGDGGEFRVLQSRSILYAFSRRPCSVRGGSACSQISSSLFQRLPP